MPGNLHHAREAMRVALGPQALPAVQFVSTIEDAVRDADLTIDCVPDELESKLEILFLIDRMAPPRTVIATPTANLSITDLASCTNRADKCISIAATAEGLTGEPMKDLLLRAAPITSTESVELASGFFRALGYEPRVERETA